MHLWCGSTCLHAHAGPFTLMYPPVSVPPDRVDMGDDLLSISIIDPPVSSQEAVCQRQLAVQQVSNTSRQQAALPLTPKEKNSSKAKQNKQKKRRMQIQITVKEHDCATVCMRPGGDLERNTDVHAHTHPHIHTGVKN